MWTSFSACAKMNTFSSALKDDSSICTVLPGTVVSCRRTLLVHFVLSGHNVHKKHLKSLFTFCHSNPSKGELQWCAEAQWKQCGISVSIVSGLSSSHSGTDDVDSWGKEEERGEAREQNGRRKEGKWERGREGVREGGRKGERKNKDIHDIWSEHCVFGFSSQEDSFL